MRLWNKLKQWWKPEPNEYDRFKVFCKAWFLAMSAIAADMERKLEAKKDDDETMS